MRERLVRDRPAPAAVWLHAASVGELTSARPILADLGNSLLITTNRTTARDLARNWGLTSRLAPFDAPGPLARFLDAVRPRLAITVEGEIWPARAAALRTRGIPQAVIGARLSERSAARWAKARFLIAPVLGGLAGLSAQDKASEDRLRTLGLPQAALWPRLDLKLIGPARAVPEPPSPARDRTVLMASTHEGEDAIVLDAFAAARAVRPDLRLILAPRHPDRAPAIAALMTARGLTPARRSQGTGPEAAILLADTLGEMDLWYRAAGTCLTGGSWVAKGGHTPWEPAARGCAIVHGPHVANFADAYARLGAAGAAEQAGVPVVIPDPARARIMGAAARATLDRDAGDPAALIARLRALAGLTVPPDMEGERTNA